MNSTATDYFHLTAADYFRQLGEYCKKCSEKKVHVFFRNERCLELTAPAKKGVGVRLHCEIQHKNGRSVIVLFFSWKNTGVKQFRHCPLTNGLVVEEERFLFLREKIKYNVVRFLELSGIDQASIEPMIVQEYSALKVLVEQTSSLTLRDFSNDKLFVVRSDLVLSRGGMMTLHGIESAMFLCPCCVRDGFVEKLNVGGATSLLLFKAKFFSAEPLNVDAVLYDGEGKYLLVKLNNNYDNLLGVVVNKDIVLTDSDKKLLDMIAHKWVLELEKNAVTPAEAS